MKEYDKDKKHILEKQLKPMASIRVAASIALGVLLLAGVAGVLMQRTSPALPGFVQEHPATPSERTVNVLEGGTQSSLESGQETMPSRGIGDMPSLTDILDKALDVAAPTSLREGEGAARDVLEKSVSSTPFLAPNDDLLALPNIGEMKVAVSGGIAGVDEYAETLGQSRDKVKFDFSRAAEHIDLRNKNLWSPRDAIRWVLYENGDVKVAKDALLTYKDLFHAKISFVKTMPISLAFTESARTLISLDQLTLNLIDAFVNYEGGRLTKENIAQYLGRYEKTEVKYFEDVVRPKTAAGGNLNGALSRIGKALGVPEVAQAQGPSFGGTITAEFICPCSFGLAIVVSPPVPNVVTITPGLSVVFPFFAPHIGAFVLGNYIPNPAACLQFVGVACVPTPGVFGTVTIMGTSI